MIKFRQKNFSIVSSTAKGATIGAGVGSLVASLTGYAPSKLKGEGRVVSGYNGLDKRLLPLAAVGAGTIIGAALGALGGVISKIEESVSKSRINNNRLMDTVVSYLEKIGFNEGIDYTLNPKIATNLKMKVCIVISKYSDDLRVLINTVSDSKLRKITEDTVKNIPNTSVINKNATDKFNEITLASISDSSVDAGLITGIAERFIRLGYPVYLVEVG